MIKTSMRAAQARWVPPGVWVEFPRKNDRRSFLPVKAVVAEDPMKMVIIHPPPDSGAFPIKRAYWDQVPYQTVFPCEQISPTANEPARQTTGD